VDAVKGRLKDGDVIVVSEKALSVAMGNLVDESRVKPGFFAKFLAYCWVRYLWGYLLGSACHLRGEMIRQFRAYPREGAAHKQVALEHVGLLHALKPFSEGGIDVSNLPFCFACLPLGDPERIALEILRKVRVVTKKRVGLMIVDTDETFSLGELHLATRRSQVRGIHSGWRVLAYIFGRMFGLKRRATPLAVVGCDLSVEEALDVAELAHHARKYGAGRTAWDIAERFEVGLTEVTWEMLESVEHRPIVIVRRRA